MADPVVKHFVVQGVADFPFAMLNIDECWPARAADAAAIAARQLDDGAVAPCRKIILATVAKYAPNRQRWITSGWRVID